MQVKRLWITEKPDMARNLAAGLALTYGAKILNQATVKTDGCLRLDNGDAVGYLFGHMIQLAPPEAYLTEAQSRGNAFAYLPLMPESFIKIPKPDRKASGDSRKGGRADQPKPAPQLLKMVALIKVAKEVVNAGDIDREGQLIVDELLIHAGVDPHGAHKPIWRLALKNPNDEEIRKLINAGLEKNGDPRWALRYKAAHARETFDWCVGMTASRAWKAVTGFSRMSVGRVTTPTLALVVKRELAIEQFRSVQYFVPVITLADGTVMRWFKRHGAEGMPGFDSMGRITSEAVARQIVSAIMGSNRGEISLAEATKKYEPPPLPFSLGTLQSTVSRRHGMTLKEVSKAAQTLYELHKMITYVGTDCRFLPTSMLQEARATIDGLGRIFPRQAAGANLELRSKAWDDSKTDEHFAIAPTGRIAPGLNEHERKVFEAVANRFMAQFYPAHEFMRLRLHALFGQDEFKASEKDVTRMGWKEVEGNTGPAIDAEDDAGSVEAATEGDDKKREGQRE